MFSMLFILSNPRMRPASLVTMTLIEELLTITIVAVLGIMVYHDNGQQYSAILTLAFSLLAIVMVFALIASADDRVFDHRSDLRVFHVRAYRDYPPALKHKLRLSMLRFGVIGISLMFILLVDVCGLVSIC